jgi:hypothetical protein
MLNWNKWLKLVPWLGACSLLAGSCVADSATAPWPSALDATRQPPGISRTLNGFPYVLSAPILGPIAPKYATYSGPTDWQGNPAIGDPYIDSLNFLALARCETGVRGGNSRAYSPHDPDGGGARYGAYQTAAVTWHYAVDLHNDPGRDPYQDPRDAPLWYQTYREKRLMLKELIRGRGSAWRHPPEAHHLTCGEQLFAGRPSTAPARIS